MSVARSSASPAAVRGGSDLSAREPGYLLYRIPCAAQDARGETAEATPPEQVNADGSTDPLEGSPESHQLPEITTPDDAVTDTPEVSPPVTTDSSPAPVPVLTSSSEWDHPPRRDSMTMHQTRNFKRGTAAVLTGGIIMGVGGVAVRSD